MRAMIASVSVIAALSLGGGVGARADDAAVAAPKGTKVVMEVLAEGVQAYACEAKGAGYEWVFKGPEALMFDKQGRQVGTHFGGPSWKNWDGSLVLGEVAGRNDAPEAGAIPWLLLRAKGHEGKGAMATVTYIRRIETKGGLAPKGGCDQSRSADSARMRYSAVYQFLAAGN